MSRTEVKSEDVQTILKMVTAPLVKSSFLTG